MTAPHDYRRLFTVWDYKSAASGQKARIVRHTEPGEHRYASAFQRIVWSGWASSKDEALLIANAESPLKWAGGAQ